ncbi:histone H1-like protein [Dinothrombium tinctorium]|uniref:Histone H1-like protein n=1 Tax=Dinothrombium tinctorium TaxID=1965070 RepID=A0A443RK00_9ACAR|nr:histone H1-like protein [Dinothrombium tinctorium]
MSSEPQTVPAAAATPTAKATPKGGKKKTAVKKAKTVASHPPIAEMVNEAITNLKDKNGSSAQAIKKYVSVHYKVDVEKLAPFIKKYLKTSVVKGDLVQTKGKGASGSFKMSKDAKAKKASKPKVKKEGGEKKATPKKEGAKKSVKKVTKEKKASPKKASAKKAAKPKEKVSKVEKKPKASKAAKPKTPKKKAATKAKKTPKKATLKK